MSTLLGIDVGTTAIKVAVVDADGACTAVASAPTPWAANRRGRVEADVLRLREAVRQAVGEGTDVAAVGVAGMAESGVGCDVEGRPLTPVIAWNDARGDETVARLQEAFGADYDRWIGQRARRVLSVAKLGWLLGQGVPVVRWLGVPELILHQLTGVEATEHSLAARTGAYDVARRMWRPEVGEALGLPAGAFPDVATAGAVMGRVSTSGAAWSGLRADIAVTIAGHDHLAGAVGAGAGEADLVNSVGTAETVLGRFAELPDLDAALAHRVTVSVAPGGVGWAAMAGAARAGIVVRRAAAALGGEVHALDRDVGAPIDAGEWISALAEDPDAPAPAGSVPALWAGVLDALCRRTAEAAERMMALRSGWDRMVVIGGGCRSGPWLRAKAARLAVPVWRSSVPDAAARGAALFAGVAAGWWPDVAAAPAAPMARVEG